MNYGTASEHLKYVHKNVLVFYNVSVSFMGLNNNIKQYTHNISYLDGSRLTNTRSAENTGIGADTDSEYRIDECLLNLVLILIQFGLIDNYTYSLFLIPVSIKFIWIKIFLRI